MTSEKAQWVSYMMTFFFGPFQLDLRRNVVGFIGIDLSSSKWSKSQDYVNNVFNPTWWFREIGLYEEWMLGVLDGGEKY